MKNLFLLLLLLMASPALGAEAAVTPIAGYKYLSLDDQSVRVPAFAMLLEFGEPDPKTAEETSRLLIAASYSYHEFEKELLYGYPDELHSINLFVNGWEQKHQYILAVMSRSDEPFSGTANTYVAGAAYAYTFKHTDNFQLALGLGLATTDNRVVPIPVVRMKYDTDWLESSLEFFTMPSFTVSLFPKKRLSFNGELYVSSVDSLRDIYFDLYAEYRLLKNNDAPSLKAGFKMDGEYFQLSTDKSFDYQYYSAYGALNFGVAELSAGYAFDGREQYDDKKNRNVGRGYFASVMLGYSL